MIKWIRSTILNESKLIRYSNGGNLFNAIWFLRCLELSAGTNCAHQNYTNTNLLKIVTRNARARVHTFISQFGQPQIHECATKQFFAKKLMSSAYGELKKKKIKSFHSTILLSIYLGCLTLENCSISRLKSALFRFGICNEIHFMHLHTLSRLFGPFKIIKYQHNLHA